MTLINTPLHLYCDFSNTGKSSGRGNWRGKTLRGMHLYTQKNSHGKQYRSNKDIELKSKMNKICA